VNMGRLLGLSRLNPFVPDKLGKWEFHIYWPELSQDATLLARVSHRHQLKRRGHERHGKFPATAYLSFERNRVENISLTSMELNGFPLYSSANSAAAAGLRNLIMTIERFGAKSLMRKV